MEVGGLIFFFLVLIALFIWLFPYAGPILLAALGWGMWLEERFSSTKAIALHWLMCALATIAYFFIFPAVAEENARKWFQLALSFDGKGWLVWFNFVVIFGLGLAQLWQPLSAFWAGRQAERQRLEAEAEAEAKAYLAASEAEERQRHDPVVQLSKELSKLEESLPRIQQEAKRLASEHHDLERALTSFGAEDDTTLLRHRLDEVDARLLGARRELASLRQMKLVLGGRLKDLQHDRGQPKLGTIDRLAEVERRYQQLTTGSSEAELTLETIKSYDELSRSSSSESADWDERLQKNTRHPC
ncbi:MAG: hypothetical protein RBU37_16115 [Myxococcota bacterium]|jgi:hypothetical protein|nr:hypothetical protein [Myxococcota bacterium]